MKPDSKWLRMSRIAAHYGVKSRGYSPDEMLQQIIALETRGEIQVSDADKVELDKIAKEDLEDVRAELLEEARA